MGRKVHEKPHWVRRALSALVFVVAALALAYVVTLMCGCTVGRSLDDDSPMIGLKAGGGDGAQLLGEVGGLLFGTPGKMGGAALGALLFGRSMGRHRGWEENDEAKKKKGEA